MRSLVLGLLAAVGIVGAVQAQGVYHQGYTRRDGTYVQPHWQSRPNNSYNDNWSVRPNINPYTGQMGTRAPTWNDQPPSHSYRRPYGSPGSSSRRW